MLHKRQSGFTLIELVIVIVLLGILAATALPKFANLTTQAQLAATRGVAGGLGDAVNIAYAQWLAGNTGGAVFTLQDGTQIQPSAQGWPEAASCSGCAAPAAASGTATLAKCQTVLANILQNPPPIVGTNALCPAPNTSTCPAACPSGTSCFTPNGSGQVCTFADPNNNVINYNITTGSVVVTVGP